MFFFLVIHCGYPTNTHQVSWKIVLKIQPWFLHHVKPLGWALQELSIHLAPFHEALITIKPTPLGFIVH